MIQPSECQFHACGRPIGADSKDAKWLTCHDHRICSVCGLPLQPIDVQIAYTALQESTEAGSGDPEETLELIHSRCTIATRRFEHLDSDPTLSIKQSTFNILNTARLMVAPDMELSIQTNENNAMLRSNEFCQQLLLHDASFDQIYTHQKMLEACLAAVSLLISKQDRPAIKARADAREAVKFKKAAKDASTSSRPVGKKSDDSSEVELAEFMQLFSIKDRKIGLELKRRRDKAIDALVKLGIPQAIAIQACNKDIAKERALTTPTEGKK